MCNLLTTIKINTIATSHCICFHKGHRPKHKFKYHWFRNRMKKKKEKKFVKPKPLLHLTTKFHIVLHTYRFLTKNHKVGCHIMSFIQIATNQLTELTRETLQDLSSMVAIFVAFFKEQIVAFPAQANTSSKSYHSH